MFSLLFRVSSAHGPFAGSRPSGNVGFLGGSLESRTPSSVSLGLPFLYELALKGTKHPSNLRTSSQVFKTTQKIHGHIHAKSLDNMKWTPENDQTVWCTEISAVCPPLTPPAPSQDSGDTCHLLKSRQSPVQFAHHSLVQPSLTTSQRRLAARPRNTLHTRHSRASGPPPKRKP